MSRFLKQALPLSLLLTAFLTLPLGAVIHKGFVHSAREAESHDFLLNTWFLAWGAHAVTTPGESLFDANAFYPRRNTLAYSDHLLGNLPFTLPMFWAKANPILVHNVLLFVSFPLSFLGMYALASRLTGSSAAALFGALVYAFCPFRFSNIERLQILSSQWMPFCMLFVHRFLDRRRAIDLVWAGVFAFVQAMVSCYYAVMFPTFLALWVGVVLVIEWWRRRAKPEATQWPRSIAKGFTCLAVCYFVACLPFFWPYVELKREFGFRRDAGENVRHSADVLSCLTVPDTNLAYGRWLREWAGDGDELFPGLIAVAMAGWALVGLCRRRAHSRLWAYGLAGALCALFTLGPSIRLAGKEIGPGPYAIVHRLVPGFGGLRNPTRFCTLAMLSLAVLSAYGYRALLLSLARKGWPRSKQIVLASAVFVGAVGEYCCVPLSTSIFPHGDRIPEPYRWLAKNEEIRVVLEMPFDLDVADRMYQYYSTYHWKKLVNGVSGWSPPEDFAKYLALAQLPHRESVQLLSDLGVDCVLLHSLPVDMRSPYLKVLADFGSTVAVAPALPRRSLRVPMPSFAECERSQWQATAQPNLADASKAIDGRLDTLWTTGRSQALGDSFTVDFGQETTLSSVHLWLGPHHDCLPVAYELECAAEPSRDFRTVARRGNCASFYRTCLLDHRDARLIISIRPTRCHAIRVTQRYAKPGCFLRPWSIAEIAVFGPGTNR